MLTWQIDRLFRSGPACLAATFVIPALLALLVDTVSDVENVLGVLLVAAGLMLIASLIGSVAAAGLAVLLFGVGAVVAEVPTLVLLVVGVGMYATLMIHELAGAFHRAPRIKPTVWRTTAVTTAVIVLLSSAAFALSYAIANLATWQAIVVPFGFAALGFAVKLAADAHVTAARRLTAKRDPSD